MSLWCEIVQSVDDAEYGLTRLVRVDRGHSAFAVRGPLGAVEYRFHHSDPDLGGVECHSSRPPNGDDDSKPSHELCALLKGKCWHDGTSLWASEHWAPGFKSGGMEWVWRELRKTYVTWLENRQ